MLQYYNIIEDNRYFDYNSYYDVVPSYDRNKFLIWEDNKYQTKQEKYIKKKYFFLSI